MCVILYTEIDGKKILLKNRDQLYRPNIEIIHEIINGIEVAYIKDLKTNWMEGLNEYGCGIVHTTYANSILKNKIFDILLSNKHNSDLYNYIKKKYNDGFLFEGNTILIKDNEVFHIENIKNNFFMEKINKNAVYTNHGINIKNSGFATGVRGLSSFLRKKLVENELNRNPNLDLYDDFVKNIINVNYTNINPLFHPYRDNNLIQQKYKMDKNIRYVSTTGQLILNLTDKELVYYTDVHNSKLVKYINKLPQNYIPKIKIIIKETEKNISNTKRVFTQKYIKDTYKKYHFNDSKTRKRIKRKKRTYW